jgi:hypothetical protein
VIVQDGKIDILGDDDGEESEQDQNITWGEGVGYGG